MIICPVCEEKIDGGSFPSLSSHFIEMERKSDSSHIMWLNGNISKSRTSGEELSRLFENFYDYSSHGLSDWIRKRFVMKFFSSDPNPFVLEMQNPTRYTLMGYVTEHYHFLKQWVKSCAFIIAKTDHYDVQKYELDNIKEEYFGEGGTPPHVELLLRMGESLGLPRKKVLESEPLRKTKEAIEFWDNLSRNGHWLDAMASMHSLELIADRNVKNYGAVYSYFNPSVFDSNLPEDVKQFLRAGYDADQYHSSDALNLVEKYARIYNMEREVQSYFLKSSEQFYRYLESRSERGKMYEKEL
jgi:pyrroloquinoline-quinone synthase